jgi:hypothetical protein
MSTPDPRVLRRRRLPSGRHAAGVRADTDAHDGRPEIGHDTGIDASRITACQIRRQPQHDVWGNQRTSCRCSTTSVTSSAWKASWPIPSAPLARIAHIQIADNLGRHQPGTGEFNYPFRFGLLDEIGYHGWVGCEYLPSGETGASLAWRDQLLAKHP